MRILNLLGKFILSLLSFILLLGISVHLFEHFQMSPLRDTDQHRSPERYLIENVKILPMYSDTVLIGQSVLVEDNRISRIGSEGFPDDIPKIDGEGGYLMPGLIDMHVHVWDRFELGLYLANGVTTLRNVWGMPMHLRMKKDLQADRLIGPSFYSSGPKLTGPTFIGDDNLNLYSVEEAKTRVQSDMALGYDFVKTYYGLEADQMQALLQLALQENIDIAAHPTPNIPYTSHLHPAIKTIEHAEDVVQLGLDYKLDSLKLKEIVAAYQAHPETQLCPTLIVYQNIHRLATEGDILENESLGYLNPLIKLTDSEKQFQRWQAQQAQDSGTANYLQKQHNFHLYILQSLHEAGASFVCGTDAGIGITLPGYSIHKELALYKSAGLSNYEVLKTATLNPSQSHNFLSDLGSLRSGNRANLILLKGNPLESLEHLKKPSLVICEGQILDRSSLEEFETTALNRSNGLATALRYLEYLLLVR